MNVTELIAGVRNRLDDTVDIQGDTQDLKFQDEELVAYADRHVRGLYRSMVFSIKEWSNFTLFLQKESARQVFKNCYEWRLPIWITAIAEVYERASSSGTNEPGFSPYLWPGAKDLQLGQKYGKYPAEGDTGWTWEGNHTLRLWNLTNIPELVVHCAKLPARMFRAKLDTDAPDVRTVYLPPSFEVGSPDLEAGALINAEIQCTDTASGSSQSYGEIRRVIDSKANAFANTTRRYQLDFEADWNTSLVQDDIIQTIVPIPHEHTNYLELLIVQTCAQKKSMELLKAIQPELQSEALRFREFAMQPRDHVKPMWRSTETRQGRASINRDKSPLYWGVYT